MGNSSKTSIDDTSSPFQRTAIPIAFFHSFSQANKPPPLKLHGWLTSCTQLIQFRFCYAVFPPHNSYHPKVLHQNHKTVLHCSRNVQATHFTLSVLRSPAEPLAVPHKESVAWSKWEPRGRLANARSKNSNYLTAVEAKWVQSRHSEVIFFPLYFVVQGRLITALFIALALSWGNRLPWTSSVRHLDQCTNSLATEGLAFQPEKIWSSQRWIIFPCWQLNAMQPIWRILFTF